MSSRELDYLETYYFWRTQLKYYTNCRVAAEFNITLSEELVYQALTTLLANNPQLITTIGESKVAKLGYHATLIESLKFSDVVEFVNDEKLNNPENILNKYQDVRFEFGKDIALWKLKVINKKYAIIIFDHILYDGGSGKNFHREFGKAISAANGSNIEGYNGPESLVYGKSADVSDACIMPSPSQIIDYTSPISYTVYEIAKAIAPKFISDTLKYWFDGNPYAKQLSYKKANMESLNVQLDGSTNNCKVLSIDSAKLKKLLSLAKEHNIKLTALIAIISNLSIDKVVSTADDMGVSIPVDLRGFIDTEKGKSACKNYSDLFGLFMSAVEIELPAINKLCPDGKINWDVAANINNSLHKNVSVSPRFIGLLQYVDPKELVTEKIEKNQKNGLEISNLGMISQQENPEISNIWFDQPSEIFSVNVISTANGANLVIRTADASMTEKFYSGIVELIDELVNM